MGAQSGLDARLEEALGAAFEAEEIMMRSLCPPRRRKTRYGQFTGKSGQKPKNPKEASIKHVSRSRYRAWRNFNQDRDKSPAWLLCQACALPLGAISGRWNLHFNLSRPWHMNGRRLSMLTTASLQKPHRA